MVELDGVLATLQRKAAACPAVDGRPVDAAVFVLRKKGRLSSPAVVDAAAVIGAQR